MRQGKTPAWYVISLRPQGEHQPLRHAAAQAGGRVVALSPWKLVALDDETVRSALRKALAAPIVIFTSPAAARFAHHLQPLTLRSKQRFIGTGAGTCAALKRAGVTAIAPSRMDSEGLLSLPELTHLHKTHVGLITAPEGRGTLAPTLCERGAHVSLAEIYIRQPKPLSSRALARLDTLQAPTWLALTSAGALHHVLSQLSPARLAHLRTFPVVAASARLVNIALQAGFAHVIQAEGPRPQQLVTAVLAFRQHNIG